MIMLVSVIIKVGTGIYALELIIIINVVLS